MLAYYSTLLPYLLLSDSQPDFHEILWCRELFCSSLKCYLWKHLTVDCLGLSTSQNTWNRKGWVQDAFTLNKGIPPHFIKKKNNNHLNLDLFSIKLQQPFGMCYFAVGLQQLLQCFLFVRKQPSYSTYFKYFLSRFIFWNPHYSKLH